MHTHQDIHNSPTIQYKFITMDMIAIRINSILNMAKASSRGRMLFMMWCTVVNMKGCGDLSVNYSIVIHALEMAQIMVLLDAMDAAKEYVLSAKKAISYDFKVDMARDIMKHRLQTQKEEDIGTLAQLPGDVIYTINALL